LELKNKHMKKLIFSFLASAVTFLCYGQSLVIESYDSVAYGNAYHTDDITAYAQVRNVSGNPIDVKVKRIDGNFNNLTASNAICWTMCYMPSVSQSPDHITIQPNELNSSFSGHVYPPMDGVEQNGAITYVFFDASNPSDSVAMTIWYSVTQTFSTPEAIAPNITSIYPNPTRDAFFLEIEAPAHARKVVTITNMVGAQVKTVEVNGTTRKRISVADLAPGVYFVSLKVDGKAVTTRRLVIAN
jgi:hypothetical protein